MTTQYFQTTKYYLTPTELDIVRLLALEYSRKEIANMMGVSLSTIHGLISRAQRRLGTNIHCLVYKAYKMGVIK